MGITATTTPPYLLGVAFVVVVVANPLLSGGSRMGATKAARA
jgi:hypothetical protein